MRLPLSLIAAAVLLSACDIVTSREPVFTAADTVGAPRPRDGVWLTGGGPCKFNQKRPVSAWPKCADWFVIRGDEALSRDRGETEWRVTIQILAAGDPQVLQLGKIDGEGFVYYVLKPTAFGTTHQVTAYRAGHIYCSPDSYPPLREKEETTTEPSLESGTFVESQMAIAEPPTSEKITKQPAPFPGFMRETEEAGCVTQSAAALRNAAKAMTTDQMAYLRVAREESRQNGRPEADIEKRLEALALESSAQWVRETTPRDRVPKAKPRGG